ncbi:hypothetical protein TI03_05590, partial [Achromatium sp. WMS1]
ENVAADIVGNLTVTDPNDPDDTGTYTYSVSDARFEVVGGQLKLKHGIALDYEEASYVDLTVTAIDSGGLTKDQTFTVNVTDEANDENEPPTAIALSSVTVTENVTDATIGTLTVTDPNPTDTTFTYIVSDDRFEVVMLNDPNDDPDLGLQPTLKLKYGTALDFEASPAVDITVTATDRGGLAKSQAFTIEVQDEEGDVNEAPTAITLSSLTVTENAASVTIGTLTVTDPNADDTHTFSVDDSRFQIDGTELKLKYGTALDYEASPAVDITVTATDSGGLSKSQAFTIEVQDEEGDVNEAPTAITLDDRTVTENVTADVVGNLTITDPNDLEGNDTYIYSVNDARFEVVGGQLKLKHGIALDYEAASYVDVIVTATDSGGLTKAQTFT